MNLTQALNRLPASEKRVIAILSGGLDSSIMTMLLTEKYGHDRVTALSFNYGQKQVKELEKAAELTSLLNVQHIVLDLKILGEIARPMSANIQGTSINMPDIKDVLGEPQPTTYVPNRNMIMYSIAAAQAEVVGAEYIFCGLQVHDLYGYYDTTSAWVKKMNSILSENRKHKIEIIAPFSDISKFDEINIASELKMLPALKHTLTCYNPDEEGRSCGKCPSCAERIASFARAGIKDPVDYSIGLDWLSIINKFEQQNV